MSVVVIGSSSDRAIEPVKPTPALLRERTKRFALRVLRVVEALPHSDAARLMGRQVLRSATSVGANYRAVNRARSRAEFIAKMGVVVEEMDETVYWLEMLVDAALVPAPRMASLLREANELLAIFAAARQTARKNARRGKDAAAPIPSP